MTGSGTDRTRPAVEGPAPVVILIEPQLAENIGMCARAMANFGLSEMRLVAPRDGWPSGGGLKKGATAAASGATHILANARLFASAAEAIADLNHVLATTARERGQMKRVMTPAEAMPGLAERIGGGERVGILFGRERIGLTNEEISLADAILTFPVNPAFASLNLAQAVLLAGYEWFSTTGGQPPFRETTLSPPARRETILSMFTYLEAELDICGFFPPGKKPVMTANLRDILHRLAMTEQEARTLRGVFKSLVEGPKKARLAARREEAGD
ncbi:RNA methyltransferase [Bosea sp. (in: a-proteobacteria)]|uniref:RNA methyltransferase n=1 Tax=Bosea sp. (in: a-proteobacteria) TaxID=1871050 RepID=UPI002625D171|nr:RNA methyltransferase [Bosea sp. (in: a-proteobacteria)]MCO5092220.1 RNA methyltransferase [Bosea sp. (in: a-proteobacteria)]